MNLIYIATPYSKFHLGIYSAFDAACWVAGQLIERGHDIYSPVVHTHAIAMQCSMDPLDHARWLKLDEAMMARCDEIWIVQMPGWEESEGVAMERETFLAAGKPERMVTWPELEVV